MIYYITLKHLYPPILLLMSLLMFQGCELRWILGYKRFKGSDMPRVLGCKDVVNDKAITEGEGCLLC